MSVTISVIVPVYNASRTIIRCIDSILNNLKDTPYSWELILINDGSTDNSLKIIHEYIDNSDIEEYVHILTQTNQGTAAAKNVGIQISKGEFIAFNDSDDEWLPGKIKLQMEYLYNHPDVAMVGGMYGKDKVHRMRKIDAQHCITINKQIFKNYFATQTVTLRRYILNKTGLFNPHMRYAEEGFFFNNMTYHYKCVLLNVRMATNICLKERWGEAGLSGNLWEMEKGELYNLKCAYQFHYVGWHLFLLAYGFSIAKFIRRLTIKYFRCLLRNR